MALPLTLSNLTATLKDVFNIDKLALDATQLTAQRTYTALDKDIVLDRDYIEVLEHDGTTITRVKTTLGYVHLLRYDGMTIDLVYF